MPFIFWFPPAVLRRWCGDLAASVSAFSYHQNDAYRYVEHRDYCCYELGVDDECNWHYYMMISSSASAIFSPFNCYKIYAGQGKKRLRPLRLIPPKNRIFEITLRKYFVFTISLSITVYKTARTNPTSLTKTWLQLSLVLLTVHHHKFQRLVSRSTPWEICEKSMKFVKSVKFEKLKSCNILYIVCNIIL